MELKKVYEAREVLKEVIRETDVIYSPKLSKKGNVYLKTENLQVTGSFKIRGSYYKISCLKEEEKAKGVIACSAGNHAQGVALAATKNGIKSIICLPEGAPISKISATKKYGAEICLVKGVYDDAYNKALELQKEYGYTFIHPFNDEEVIAGQGTIALEILEQVKNLDAVIVPIGGGGLISGIAYTIKQINPNIKVYGVEAMGASSMLKSFEYGKVSELSKVTTIADGIAVKKPGDLTYELCKKYVDEIVTVTDDEIAAAILTLMEEQKLITEGAGATSVAAVMFDKIDVKDKNVVCILSGGNIDVTILSRIINKGLLMTGRTCKLKIELPDVSGQLNNVTKIIADLGANIISIDHERLIESSNVNSCYLNITLETKNFKHIHEIKKALMDNEYKLI